MGYCLCGGGYFWVDVVGFYGGDGGGYGVGKNGDFMCRGVYIDCFGNGSWGG